ncbi:MAG: TatD family hydrolase [Candidatus Nanohaloarchaea archaeon]
MIDGHCHLQFEQFDEDREQLISKIEEKLDLAIIAGTDLKDNREAKNISESSEELIYCQGAHPLFDHPDLEEIKEQINENEPAAIGEIGLDHNYITADEERKESEEIFREMLELAEAEDLNVVVHSRNAERKAFKIVQEYDVKGFFHCFNGRPELVEEIISEGHLIGVTGQVLHSTRVKNIVEKVPLESLLTETDSPYLGEYDRNTPLFVEKVTEEVSEIKDVDVEEVEASVEENVEEFFRYYC